MNYDILKRQIFVILDLNKDYEFNIQLLNAANIVAKELKKTIIGYAIGYEKNEYLLFQEHGLRYIIVSNKYVQLSNLVDSCASSIRIYEPELIIACDSKPNKELLVQIATSIECGIVADCISIQIIDEHIVFSRTAINESLVADIQCTNSKYAACTIKKGYFKEKVDFKLNPLTVIPSNYTYKDDIDFKTKLKEDQIPILKEIKLNSRVVIGVGRGAINNLTQIRKLAGLINADIGSTRALVDCNMFSNKLQIGQSGHSIAPDLYIALGVSGASQHIVGILDSKTIIAVNTDKNAPIFQFADYIINEDVKVFVDKIIKRIEG